MSASFIVVEAYDRNCSQDSEAGREEGRKTRGNSTPTDLLFMTYFLARRCVAKFLAYRHQLGSKH